jgi:uncharacterized damage-inducible protein DinB
MSIIQMFQKELEMEAKTTRKMLQVVPDDKYDWQPHPKSMTIRSLATHIAELPTWITMTLTTNELDFATIEYTPAVINNTAELLEYFEKSLEDGRAHLKTANEAQLSDIWTMRNGDKIYDASPKSEVILMTFFHLVHHRAQLGVSLRLLDIPIPGSYGPSADSGSEF